MKECASHEELLRDPAGRWLPIGTGLFWCQSPTLCGFAVWDSPGATEIRTLVRVFDGYRRLAPRFDVLQDGRDVKSIDPAALDVITDWLRSHASILRDHIRARVAVLPPGVAGLALAGLQVTLALENPVKVFTDAREAYRHLQPHGGDQSFEAVEALIHRARGLTPVVIALRGALSETRGALDVAGAAKRLGLSARSLQRQLAQASVSFRAEQAEIRFRAAEDLLGGTTKLSAVAAQLGMSEDALAQLTSARTGLRPSELRRRLRGE